MAFGLRLCLQDPFYWTRGLSSAGRAPLLQGGGQGFDPPSLHRKARDTRNRAAMTRAEADELRSLPVNEAAERIEAKRAEQEQARQRAAERAQRLPDPFAHDPHRSGPHREGPTRSL